MPFTNAGWDQITEAFGKLHPKDNILTHFRTPKGNGYTITTDMTTEQILNCYVDLIHKPKTAAQILSITFAITLHLL